MKQKKQEINKKKQETGRMPSQVRMNQEALANAKQSANNAVRRVKANQLI